MLRFRLKNRAASVTADMRVRRECWCLLQGRARTYAIRFCQGNARICLRDLAHPHSAAARRRGHARYNETAYRSCILMARRGARVRFSRSLNIPPLLLPRAPSVRFTWISICVATFIRIYVKSGWEPRPRSAELRNHRYGALRNGAHESGLSPLHASFFSLFRLRFGN